MSVFGAIFTVLLALFGGALLVFRAFSLFATGYSTGAFLFLSIRVIVLFYVILVAGFSVLSFSYLMFRFVIGRFFLCFCWSYHGIFTALCYWCVLIFACCVLM